MNALQQLARWAATVTAGEFSCQWQQAKDWATIALIDTIGCMTAGSHHPASQLNYEALAQWGSGRSTAIGHLQPMSPPWAAMVNGTSGHALDFNAWDERSASHSSPVLLAALLAVAEAEGKSGMDVIDAFIVGMEITMRVGAAVNLDHYHIGWHTTNTVATIGGAVACARLLELDERGIGNAISIATSHTGGYKSQFGTTMKPIHCGMAAKAAVMSAYLARTGIEGAADTLDGQWSLLSLQATNKAPGFATALADLGKSLALAAYGVVLKPYPSCAYTHRSIDGLLDLRSEHGFSAENVTQINARIPFYNASILPYTHPVNDTEARFCMAYCLSIALLNGAVLPGDFDEESIFKPEIRTWLDRIVLETHPVVKGSSDLSTQEPAVVTVKLADGSVLDMTVDYARGMPQRPLIRDELEAKFIGLAEGKLGKHSAAKLLEQLWHFEQLADIDSFLNLLRFE
ncbi:MAG: MmgE/PrpD family protein [Chloroflexota bacterium]